MDSNLKKDELDAIYGDEYVDITDEVICYENGKVFACECGQDVGVIHSKFAVKCASCGKMLVDLEADERGPPEREQEQTGLSEWV
jgi:hypothetical protein